MQNDRTYITFSLHNEQDYMLISWLKEQSNRSEIIRKALAKIMRNSQNELSEILEIVRELQSREFTIVSNGSALQTTKQVEETESQDITDSLGNLGV